MATAIAVPVIDIVGAAAAEGGTAVQIALQNVGESGPVHPFHSVPGGHAWYWPNVLCSCAQTSSQLAWLVRPVLHELGTALTSQVQQP